MKFTELCWSAFFYYINSYYEDYADTPYFKLFKKENTFLQQLRQNPSAVSDQDFENKVVGFLNEWRNRTPYELAPEIKENLINLTPHFVSLRDQTIESCHFDQEGFKDDIVTIYDSLTKINGFSDTGTSKILHVMNDGLFVMWDKAIREHYYHTGKSPSGGEGYLNFLKEMQMETAQVSDDYRRLGFYGTPSQFISQKLNYPFTKTFAKFIDEFNWVKFTKKIPIPPKQTDIELLKILIGNV